MNDTEHTHTLQIIVRQRYGGREMIAADLLVAGDGSVEHMLDTYQAGMVAAGFSPETACRLTLIKRTHDGL